MPLHAGKDGAAGHAICRVIGYVENPEKTDGGTLISAFACDPKTADLEFLLNKQQYRTRTGRTQERDVIAYHFRQSFRPGEITPEEANEIGQAFAHRFLKDSYAFIVCTHVDKAHIHNHIVWDATALDCTRKFRNFWGSTDAVRALSDRICLEHGLSVIEPQTRRGASYDVWLGDRKPKTHRQVLAADLAAAMVRKPRDTEALIRLLQDAGYTVRRGRQLSVRRSGWDRFVRVDDPFRTPAAQKVELLIDIQKKLEEGYGGGFRRWASVRNVKAMAATMNYLRAHHGMDRAGLERAADAALARFRELSAAIRTCETQMKEIMELKAQIIQYRKTLEIFDAYRRGGYTKKFLAAHEQEILAHRAAKRFFNEHKLRKLPSIRALQEEYGRLLAEKKASCSEYKTAREEMKQLAIVRKNVADMLGRPAPEMQKTEVQSR